MLLATAFGYWLNMCNLIQGKQGPTTLYDYPSFIQERIINNAAKQAGEKQRAVVAEFERNSK